MWEAPHRQTAASLRCDAVSSSEEAGCALGLRLPPQRQLRKCLAVHLENLAAMGTFSLTSHFCCNALLVSRGSTSFAGCC